MLVTKKLFSLSPSAKLLKTLLEGHTLHSVRGVSQSFNYEDIFKFYSDAPAPAATPLTDRDYERFISKRSALRQPGLTRQITQLSYQAGRDAVSLAEGMASTAVFPFTHLRLETSGGAEVTLEGDKLRAALQYVPTQGLPDLVSHLRQLTSDLHRPPPLPRDVLVTSGSQSGLYMAVDLLLEPGAPVLVQEHSYTGFYSVLKPYQPEIIGIPEDQHGVIPEILESVLEERLCKGQLMPKFFYLVPTGSNPTGTVLPEGRRRKIYELACRYDFLILEDDPYMFVNYTDQPVPSFLSLDSAGRVIRLDSFSKVLSPGLRAAWATAPPALLQRLQLHQEAHCLHSCTLAMAILLQLLQTWGRAGLATQLRGARALYRARRDALAAALRAHCAHLAHWHVPEGGMFFWVRLNVEDVRDMVFKTAFEKGLMLVPGQACNYDASAPSPHLRLAFSKVKLEDMDTAARLLADVIRTEQAKACSNRAERVATHR
ncbi:kynurenine/alpha-aminoadipate aminotransferase, mitochondrial [Plutella xylostella]|uniref:kynurenine/alpha-aminoadipate aminotransferase, mitochondrial n=1 Tax=Plutella xylostella TaxID=51655 RepID=UPI0020325426|nr:kynurenine/alpha-aminoadipate aminotransferase, mitochondrial [Plutella xylostella]